VCSHENRAALEAAATYAVELADVACRFGVSARALGNHMARHVGEKDSSDDRKISSPASDADVPPTTRSPGVAPLEHELAAASFD